MTTKDEIKKGISRETGGAYFSLLVGIPILAGLGLVSLFLGAPIYYGVSIIMGATCIGSLWAYVEKIERNQSRIIELLESEKKSQD